MSVVSDLVAPASVVLDVAVADKAALFGQVARLLEPVAARSRGQIVDSLLEREALGSTGLGQGIAIPHGRVPGLREAVGAFVRVNPPMGFDAPDGQPVSLVFVLLVPERATELHLQILSELVQMFSDRSLRDQLASNTDAQAVHRMLCTWPAAAA